MADRDVIAPADLADLVAQTGFSPAIRAGDFLFLTGATGGAPDGTMPADVTTQLTNALNKVEAILHAAPATLDQIVEVTSYHRDIDTTFAEVDKTLRARLGEPLPAWTAVEVSNLRRAGALIELRIVVHAPTNAPAT